MHTHSSLWKDGKPLFAGDEYAGLARWLLFCIGGLSSTPRHYTPSPIRRPTATSGSCRDSKRRSTWPIRPQSVGVDAYPDLFAESKAKRVEFRTPDPAATPYLAFAAIAARGLDGIQNRIDPGDPLDKDLYELPPEEIAKVPTVPGFAARRRSKPSKTTTNSCSRGTCSPRRFLDNWVELKKKEYDALRLRPHACEFYVFRSLIRLVREGFIRKGARGIWGAFFLTS